MHPQVTNYIINSRNQQEILQTIRQLIHETVAQVTEEFKWGRPVFRTNKDFAYLKTAKNYVTLGFFNFEKLSDPDNRLEGTGKGMRHIKIKTINELDRNLLTAWFKAATIN
ncbi:DUF1801 domain-containing protein [Pontibacter sp. BT310]|uniref:DUF1801 domain-containing protein n=1 Tax=Pontibacter populi TaxID=890055 RepID=A0ABS6XCW5_9BACT|nr:MULTISPECIES: DUF1801 domain-containing protein [Pontibacter]MBJ6118988.1 DUF1801 domain-containing protein [Pontibacter sp. BT310]MBR0571416.1 DUF1801 domain-containing protein [Microvirga sp. STS03]MBW3365842.1 DUF1801 domain-containing protein [Pontibacter populi]